MFAWVNCLPRVLKGARSAIIHKMKFLAVFAYFAAVCVADGDILRIDMDSLYEDVVTITPASDMNPQPIMSLSNDAPIDFSYTIADLPRFQDVLHSASRFTAFIPKGIAFGAHVDAPSTSSAQETAEHQGGQAFISARIREDRLTLGRFHVSCRPTNQIRNLVDGARYRLGIVFQAHALPNVRVIVWFQKMLIKKMETDRIHSQARFEPRGRSGLGNAVDFDSEEDDEEQNDAESGYDFDKNSDKPKYPVLRFRNPAEFDKDDLSKECSVCQSELNSAGSTEMDISCCQCWDGNPDDSRLGHAFHTECLNNWRHRHSTCPDCRAEIAEI